jgi:hypothetical protein
VPPRTGATRINQKQKADASESGKTQKRLRSKKVLTTPRN